MATPELPRWMFREFEPVGVDLDSVASVEAYDRNQGTDPDAEDALLDRLDVGAGTVCVDLGTGTGSLPVQAARRGAEAHGVDVSETMLAFARRRASEAGVEVVLHHAGFLTYAHDGEVDVVTMRSALHQLPDTWKQFALTRAAASLRSGGRLFVRDAMWSFDPDAAGTELPAWAATMAQEPGVGFTLEMFETHLREEFSTYHWIIQGMIERAGLRIVESTTPSPWYGEVLAVKP